MARWKWNERLAGGMMLSFSVHAIPVGKSFLNLYETRAYIRDARAVVHEFLWSEYDVQIEPEKLKDEPKAPERPEEAPVAEAAPAPPKSAPKAPPQEKKAVEPPPAAQAGQVLTAKADPAAAADFTDFTMVQGDAGTYAGGITDSKGTGKDAVYDRGARGSGSGGGRGTPEGTGTATAAPTGPDLSKPASPSSRDWSCSHLFPPEADEADVNQAVVTVIVTVGADGSPRSVKIVADPGNGFGRAARTCALAQRYTAALDRDGKGTTGATPPFTVRFTR